MRRTLALLDHAVGAMRRRAGRNAAIAVGLAVVVGFFGSLTFVAEALRAEYAALAEGLPDLAVQRLVAGRPGLISLAEVAAIEALDLPSVRSVRGRAWGYLYVAPLEGNVVVVGIAPGEGTARNGELGAGRFPTGDDEAAIGRALAVLLGARVGDEIAIAPSDLVSSDPEMLPRVLTVVGLLDESTQILSADLLLTSDRTARALLAIPEDQATDLAITLSRPEEAAVVTEAIAARLPSVRIVDRQLLRRVYELTFDARAGFASVTLVPALLALLLLAWDRLTGLSEGERREIGVLKAVGWSTSDVLTARLWESGCVAFLGTASGLVLAYVHAFVLGAPGLRDALFGWSSMHAELALTPRVDLAQLVAVVGAVVVPFVAVSVVPAWRAAMLDPDQVLRGGAVA